MQDNRDVADLLLERGIRLKSYAPNSEGYTTCPSCSPFRKKKTAPCLSVKIDDDDGAVFHCNHCQMKGNIPGRRIRAGTGDRPSLRGGSSSPPKAPVRPAQPKATPRPPAVLAWFEKRGIPEETLVRFGVFATKAYFPQTQQEENAIAFPYFRRGELVNFKYRSGRKDFAQSKGAERSLYNVDGLTDNDTGIFTEGEIDVLTYDVAGYSNAVSLCDGAPKEAKEEIDENDKRYAPLLTCETQIEPIKKWIIATDGDAPGNALAEEVARRLGKEKCWRVVYPPGYKDANEILVGVPEKGLPALGVAGVRALIEEAIPYPVEGLQEFQHGLLFDLRVRAPSLAHSTGILSLDEIYKIAPGQLTIVTGLPNSGKSEFVDQLMCNLAMREGWRSAICSFENPMDEHGAKLAEKFIGKSFRGTDRYNAMEDTEVARAEGWIRSHFVWIKQDDPDKAITMDWIIDRLRVAVRRYGIKAAVIDPYNRISDQIPNGMHETDYVKVILSRLQRFCQLTGVHLWFVAHPGKYQANPKTGKQDPPSPNHISGSAHWYNIPDNCITVHRPEPRMPISDIYTTKIRWKWVGVKDNRRLSWSSESGRYSALHGYGGNDEDLEELGNLEKGRRSRI